MLALLLCAAMLLSAAAVAKAAVDVLTHQAGNNVFERLGPWWDARVSWKNKYAPGSWEAGAPVPAFWGSTGPLVALTDFWHFADFLYLSCYFLGAACLGVACQGWTARPVPLAVLIFLALLLTKVLFGAVFELCYQRLFRLVR